MLLIVKLHNYREPIFLLYILFKENKVYVQTIAVLWKDKTSVLEFLASTEM